MIFIRDAEIEHYLRELSAPVFRAAGLDPRAVDLLIIQNGDMNAFVAGGQNIFIYTGLLEAAKTPDQLLGVIAHETGHIAGGHLVQGSQQMRNASAQAILGMLAALAAGLATGSGELAAGAVGAAQNVAERSILSYSRVQESSADAAALRFLDASGLSAQGFIEFMQTLSGQELLPSDRQSEYVRTHPLSQDRIAAIAHHLDSPSRAGKAGLPSHFTGQHARMQAKLLGYIRPEAALLRHTDKDPQIEARYARAIALDRKSRLAEALPLVEGLLREEPDNPFFHELKAQMLFENGRIEEAVSSYEKSVELLPASALLRVATAHALLETRDDARLDGAIAHLLEAERLEARDPQTWRFLAAAWSRKGLIDKEPSFQGLALYALAEEAAAFGKNEVAKSYAERSIKLLPKNSPYRLRAQDLGMEVEEALKN